MPATLIYSPLIPTSYALVGGFAARYVRRGMRRTPPAVYGNGISLSGERYLHRNAQLFPVNPLTGIWVTHHTALGYRHASPDEESLPLPIEGNHSEVHQQTANYSLLTANWTFTFSAKERDSETGLSYFGSRYYSSDLSIWLSVDPMAAKYPSLSPYTYCANNPVKLVDPNGEEFIGAVMGVLIGATTEIISQTIANGMNNLSEGENFFKGWGSKIDWVDVGVSAAVGALDGMAPGLGRTIAKVAGDVGGDILKASLDWKGENKPINGNGWGVVFYSKDPIRAACDLITNLANTGFKYASGINDISLINRSFSISGLLFESSLIGSFSGIFGTINYLVKSEIDRIRNSHVEVGPVQFIVSD